MVEGQTRLQATKNMTRLFNKGFLPERIIDVQGEQAAIFIDSEGEGAFHLQYNHASRAPGVRLRVEEEDAVLFITTC